MKSLSLSELMSQWFAKRAPKSDSVQLNLRSVYIFFSKEGALFAVLLTITFVAGINYANNLVLGLFFYLASVWFISFHITFTHVSGLKVELVDITTAEAGAPVWVTIKLINEARQPRRQLLLSFDLGKTAEKSAANAKNNSNSTSNQDESAVLVPELKKEVQIRLPVSTSNRGKFILPRLIIKSTYPLGIMRAWSYVYFAKVTWVTPKPLVFDWQTKFVAAQATDTAVSGRAVQGQDDFEQLSSYVEGESLARVSWAHVARGQGMLTKHFADPLGQEFCLDYADMPASTHEQKLSQLAFGVNELARAGTPFQLVLPDAASSPIGQGTQFSQACLLRLAKAP